MLKYCFIIDENKGLVQLGAGCSDEYYEEIGMEKRDVEQSDINNLWYLAEKCPHKSEEEKFQEAKEAKYQEALQGAVNFIECEAYYQFDPINSIEATDGNIGKMTAYALGFQAGMLEQVTWTSREDRVIVLNAEDVLRVLTGLGEIQADVWNRQFMGYKSQIDHAHTIEDINNIEIDYKQMEE